jgi:hypothetical protein
MGTGAVVRKKAISGSRSEPSRTDYRADAVDRDTNPAEMTPREILGVEFGALIHDMRTSKDKHWREMNTAQKLPLIISRVYVAEIELSAQMSAYVYSTMSTCNLWTSAAAWTRR